MIVPGVDVGGSSIKAARVDTSTGQVLAEPLSVTTPMPATAPAIVRAARKLLDRLAQAGPVGIAFPAVVKNGTLRTAANLDPSCIGVNVEQLARRELERPVLFLNDADAAGLAEMRFGAGVGRRGTVMVLTFGTGIGSALFTDGHLFPNTEFGHLQLDGVEAEHLASGRARTVEQLDWKEWAQRVNRVLHAYHSLLWPDVFILCGGVTEHYAEFAPMLDSPAEIIPARYRAQAGIVGAALAGLEAAGGGLAA